MPWMEQSWDTRHVSYANPTDEHFHASLMLGFTDTQQRGACFESEAIAKLSDRVPVCISAIHAYDVSEALTYVKERRVLPHYES